MLKRSRKPAKSHLEIIRQPEPPRDENESALDVLQHIIAKTEAPTKNPAAVALGRLGGLKGGKARASKLTGDERSESARNAAIALWKKKRGALP